MPKSQRLTIKPHNIEFLRAIAAQMEVEDLSEVLNYLILDIKGLGYKFGDKPAPTPRQAPIGYSFDTSTFEPSFSLKNDTDRNERNYQESSDRTYLEIDPTIQRLLDAGLEMDF